VNIYWILTDSINASITNDKFSLLKTYQTLMRNNEGLFFKNAISLFPSTLGSILSIITGKNPLKIMPDFLDKPPKELENILLKENYFKVLKENNFNVYSFICFNIGSNWLKSITNPVIPFNKYKGSNQLNSLEVNNEFFKFFENNQDTVKEKNNLFYIHYMAGDTSMDEGLRNLIKFLKKEKEWDDSIILINSDHGYRIFRKSKNLLHFDDIHINSLNPAVFLKLPQNLSNKKGIIDKRVYLIDLFETILDYLNLSDKINYKRDAISFKNLIEKGKDVNKDRIVVGSAYFYFQPIKKLFIVKNNFKLDIIKNNFFLKKLVNKNGNLEEITIDLKNNTIYKELLSFYNTYKKEVLISLERQLEILFENSRLSKIKNKKIIIFKRQFPPYLVKFLFKKLKIYNEVHFFEDVKSNKAYKNKEYDYAIFIYNRLTGCCINSLRKRLYNSFKVKQEIIINSLIIEVKDKPGYLNFLLKEIKNKKFLLLKRPVNTFIWLVYFPLVLNRNLKKYY
jgi:hypothetical protein